MWKVSISASCRRVIIHSLTSFIGHRLGHYLVLDKLGSGGMGDVYVAEDTKLNRRVALKFLRRDGGEARDSRSRILREARAAAALNHPNIVHLYSVEETDDLVFITMELVTGHSLRQLLAPGTGLSLAQTISFATQMAEALACAHAAGIVHRDLKPGNVMITDDERVKILDADESRERPAAPSGSFDLASGELVASAGEGTAVRIHRLQRAGRKPVTGAEFARAARLPGRFGAPR